MPAHDKRKQNKKKSEKSYHHHKGIAPPLFLILFLLLPFLILLHFFFLLFIIMEDKAKASPREEGLWATKKSYLFVPFLQLHFLAETSSDESSITFTFPMVVFGQIRLTKHLAKYSSLYVENCDRQTD